MKALEINEKLIQFLQSKIKVYPCNNLRASNIGHPCERYLYLLIKHWDEQQPHDAGLQAIFDLGTHLEEHAINSLKKAGFEVITPTVKSWKIENPLITGREDIRIKDESGEFFPAEVKWLSPFEFEKLNNIEDFHKSKRYYVRGYPAQLYVYMYKFAKEKGYFVLGNKLTGEIKVIDVPFDWDYADKLLKKGEKIYKALETNDPKELDTAQDSSICDRCSLAHICGAQINRAEADIDGTGELDELIDKKNSLMPVIAEYEEIKEKIKQAVGSSQKIITGKYLLTKNIFTKKSYIVPERTEQRINIKRL